MTDFVNKLRSAASDLRLQNTRDFVTRGEVAGILENLASSISREIPIPELSEEEIAAIDEIIDKSEAGE